MGPEEDVNVVGGSLLPCSADPLTGYYRNGRCSTGPDDLGSHTVAAVMTDQFLQFSAAAGNDLSTPHPELGFPGLVAGDRWCLCAARWLEAFEAGVAPPVVLGATHRRALEIVPIEALVRHAWLHDDPGSDFPDDADESGGDPGEWPADGPGSGGSALL